MIKKTNTPKKFGLIDYELLCKNPSLHKEEYSTVTYRPSEVQKYKDYETLVTEKWDIFALGITLIQLMDGYHPYIDELEEWNEELEDFEHESLHLKKDQLHMNLFLDQDVINNAVENCKMLNKDENWELKDLIVNMLWDDFEVRFGVDDVMEHPWFQEHCV